MVRRNTQNGEKCCDNHPPLKTAVHNGYNCPWSMIIKQFARCRISTPGGMRRGNCFPSETPRGVCSPMPNLKAQSLLACAQEGPTCTAGRSVMGHTKGGGLFKF